MSQLVLLSQLGQLDKNTKVRFLGCIDSYDLTTATLRLCHRSPTSEISATVDVRSIIDGAKHLELQDGAWVNVIGYVIEPPKQTGSTATIGRRFSRGKRSSKTSGSKAPAFVQAVMLWSAGVINVDEYEKSVEIRAEAIDLNV